MMLIILSDNPVKSAELLPKSIRHKQLLELMQMLSCVVNFGYEKLPNGKAIKQWISKHKRWMHIYSMALFNLFYKEAKNPKEETIIKYRCLIDLLECACKNEEYIEPTTAILRYKEGYECKYPTNTELPISEAISIYNDYVHNFKRWE